MTSSRPVPELRDVTHADIGFVSALPMELAPFIERCAKVRRYTGGHFTFRGGRYDDIRIAFAECGMGFANARKATQALIDAHTPKWIISAGYCGALLPEMRIGDILMANSIADTHGQELSVDVNMPENREQGLYVGRLLTSDKLVRTVLEKQQLAEQFKALAVDMESLAVAQVCHETKTRFLGVRVVSDDLSVDLPPEVLTIVGSTGYMRIGAAIGALWKRPSSAKDIWHLRESARKASARLASFLDGVVVQLHQAAH